MIDTVFLASALLGGGVFAVRTLMQFLGVGGDEHAGADLDDVHADADAGFRLLSLQGMSAFLMMFGLVGLALVRQSGVQETIALALATAAGLAAVWVIGKLFALMGTLRSSGTISMYSAVGEEGTIYLSVPRDGIGKVQVVVQGRLSILDARADDGADIPTGARVRVVGVSRGDLLLVQAIESKSTAQLAPL